MSRYAFLILALLGLASSALADPTPTVTSTPYIKLDLKGLKIQSGQTPALRIQVTNSSFGDISLSQLQLKFWLDSAASNLQVGNLKLLDGSGTQIGTATGQISISAMSPVLTCDPQHVAAYEVTVTFSSTTNLVHGGGTLVSGGQGISWHRASSADYSKVDPLSDTTYTDNTRFMLIYNGSRVCEWLTVPDPMTGIAPCGLVCQVP